MKTIRVALVFPMVATLFLHGCGDSGGPSADDAMKSTAPAITAPKDAKAGKDRGSKTLKGIAPAST